MTFEDFSRINRGTKTQDSIDPKIQIAALEILRRKRVTAAMFRDVYSPEKLVADRAFVKEREESFLVQSPDQVEKKKKADAFEAFLHVAIANGEWFGGNAETLPVAKFDDYQNGVDLLVETRSDGGFGHLAMSIDVTFGELEISKKLAVFARKIKQDQLTRVEYFHSPRMQFTGVMENVPTAVVGLDGASLNDLFKFTVNPASPDLKKSIEQFILLEEIILQLEVFKSYAVKVSSNPEKRKMMYDRLEMMLVQMKLILGSKNSLKEELFADEKDYQKVLMGDRIYKEIKGVLETYRR